LRLPITVKSIYKIILASFLVILFALTIFAGYLISNKRVLTAYFLEQINSHLTGQLKVNSSDVTVFKNFPNVSLDLMGVSISKSDSIILNAKHMYLGFNIKDIFNKKYKIQIITIDSAAVNLVIYKNGENNFDIIKKGNEAQNGDDQFLLDLEKVKLRSIDFSFIDLQSTQKYQTKIHEFEMDGKFKSNEFKLNIFANAFVKNISSNEIAFLSNKNLMIKANIDVNNSKKVYQFKNAQIKLNELDLILNGNIKNKANGNELAIDFDSKKISITSLLSLLPIKIPQEVLAYKSNGNVFFKGNINGLIGPKNNPKINVDFGISNGSIHNEKLNIDLKNISLIGKFNNGEKQDLTSSKLSLNNFKATLENDEISGDINLENLLNPKIDVALLGTVNLENLVKIFPVSSIEKIKGSLQFDTKIKADLANNDPASIWKQNGNYGKFNLLISDFKIKNFDKTIDNLAADFTLNGADLLVQKCNINLSQSDINIQGNLNNILGYLFSKNEILKAKISYKSNYVDLAHVVFMPEANANDKKATNYNLPQNIELQLNASIDKLKFNNFIANNVECALQVLPMQIIISQAKLKAFNGNLLFNAKVLNSEQGNYFIESKIDLKNVNITDAFQQCNNFGQENITDKNIKGIYNGSIDFAGVWDNQLNCKTDKIYAQIKAQILNGELINYKPLSALSKFISLNDLQNLKFATLNNTIEISKKTITIPKMQIENNAANITLSGSQNFDNFIDYNLKVNLSDILRKKLSAKDNAFGEEDEKRKGLNLFINMRGPIDDLKFKYSKKETSKNIKEGLKKETESIKDILKKEFGIKPNDGKLNTNKPKEKQNETDELEFEKD
jgi:hypothetical protein